MNQSSFFKLFPVPRYLQFPAVGLDMSDGSIKFIELIRGNGTESVGRFGITRFIDDPIPALSAIREEYGLGMVNASVPEEEAFFVRMRLPFIKPEEVRGAIELQIEEYVPYPAVEIEFDFEILKSDPRPGGYLDVNISALPKKILKKYLDIFRGAGLRPISLMIEADATSRAVVPVDFTGTAMVINIGRRNTVLSIVAKSSVWFSYTFQFGGDMIVSRLEETFRVDSSRAEKLKNERGLINTPDNQDVFGCLLPMISSVRDEARKHIKYWSENREEFLFAKDTEEISRVLLCGSQAIIPGLTDYMSTALRIRASLADPWVNIFNYDEYIPPIKRKDSLEYATAIGLAMGSLR